MERKSFSYDDVAKKKAEKERREKHLRYTILIHRLGNFTGFAILGTIFVFVIAGVSVYHHKNFDLLLTPNPIVQYDLENNTTPSLNITGEESPPQITAEEQTDSTTDSYFRTTGGVSSTTSQIHEQTTDEQPLFPTTKDQPTTFTTFQFYIPDSCENSEICSNTCDESNGACNTICESDQHTCIQQCKRGNDYCLQFCVDTLLSCNMKCAQHKLTCNIKCNEICLI